MSDTDITDQPLIDPEENAAHLPERNNEWEEVVVTGATPPADDIVEKNERYWGFTLARTADTSGRQWQIRRPDDVSAAMFREAYETKTPVRVPTVELELDAEQV